MPETTPVTPTATPEAKCTRSGNLSQPYKNSPSAMASRKNAVPSHEKGKPMMGPACTMKVGHRNPSSSESTVPDTAPTAKNTATPLAHARASW